MGQTVRLDILVRDAGLYGFRFRYLIDTASQQRGWPQRLGHVPRKVDFPFHHRREGVTTNRVQARPHRACQSDPTLSTLALRRSISPERYHSQY